MMKMWLITVKSTRSFGRRVVVRTVQYITTCLRTGIGRMIIPWEVDPKVI